jgi:penicillin V acylase-like amidase (Ntn superfamily)
MRKTFTNIVAAFTVGLLATQDALACSRALWQSPDGQVLIGRTQDWTEKADSAFRMFPRGIDRVGAVSENPLTWTSKYGSLILTGYNMATHEGVNEAGLSAHLLYLAEDAAFGDRDVAKPAISAMEWLQYYLDNFATVEEAVAATEADAFQVRPLILPNGFPTEVHMSLSDKSGDSAVIEYRDGKPRIFHDRRYTVMTNEPSYDLQIENLKKYKTFGGDQALPGDRTPTDRFVRAAYYVNGLQKPADRTEAAAFMFSVIRNVSVPFGQGDPDRPNIASTIFRTVQDLTGQRYYFESTFAPNVVWVNYDQIDFSAGGPQLELEVEEKIFELNGDVTPLLAPVDPFVWGKAEG